MKIKSENRNKLSQKKIEKNPHDQSTEKLIVESKAIKKQPKPDKLNESVFKLRETHANIFQRDKINGAITQAEVANPLIVSNDERSRAVSYFAKEVFNPNHEINCEAIAKHCLGLKSEEKIDIRLETITNNLLINQSKTFSQIITRSTTDLLALLFLRHNQQNIGQCFTKNKLNSTNLIEFLKNNCHISDDNINAIRKNLNDYAANITLLNNGDIQFNKCTIASTVLNPNNMNEEFTLRTSFIATEKPAWIDKFMNAPEVNSFNLPPQENLTATTKSFLKISDKLNSAYNNETNNISGLNTFNNKYYQDGKPYTGKIASFEFKDGNYISPSKAPTIKSHINIPMEQTNPDISQTHNAATFGANTNELNNKQPERPEFASLHNANTEAEVKPTINESNKQPPEKPQEKFLTRSETNNTAEEITLTFKDGIYSLGDKPYSGMLDYQDLRDNKDKVIKQILFIDGRPRAVAKNNGPKTSFSPLLQHSDLTLHELLDQPSSNQKSAKLKCISTKDNKQEFLFDSNNVFIAESQQPTKNQIFTAKDGTRYLLSQNHSIIGFCRLGEKWVTSEHNIAILETPDGIYYTLKAKESKYDDSTKFTKASDEKGNPITFADIKEQNKPKNQLTEQEWTIIFNPIFEKTRQSVNESKKEEEGSFTQEDGNYVGQLTPDEYCKSIVNQILQQNVLNDEAMLPQIDNAIEALTKIIKDIEKDGYASQIDSATIAQNLLADYDYWQQKKSTPEQIAPVIHKLKILAKNLLIGIEEFITQIYDKTNDIKLITTFVQAYYDEESLSYSNDCAGLLKKIYVKDVELAKQVIEQFAKLLFSQTKVDFLISCYNNGLSQDSKFYIDVLKSTEKDLIQFISTINIKEDEYQTFVKSLNLTSELQQKLINKKVFNNPNHKDLIDYKNLYEISKNQANCQELLKQYLTTENLFVEYIQAAFPNGAAIEECTKHIKLYYPEQAQQQEFVEKLCKINPCYNNLLGTLECTEALKPLATRAFQQISTNNQAPAKAFADFVEKEFINTEEALAIIGKELKLYHEEEFIALFADLMEVKPDFSGQSLRFTSDSNIRIKILRLDVPDDVCVKGFNKMLEKIITDNENNPKYKEIRSQLQNPETRLEYFAQFIKEAFQINYHNRSYNDIAFRYNDLNKIFDVFVAYNKTQQIEKQKQCILPRFLKFLDDVDFQFYLNVTHNYLTSETRDLLYQAIHKLDISYADLLTIPTILTEKNEKLKSENTQGGVPKHIVSKLLRPATICSWILQQNLNQQQIKDIIQKDSKFSYKTNDEKLKFILSITYNSEIRQALATEYGLNYNPDNVEQLCVNEKNINRIIANIKADNSSPEIIVKILKEFAKNNLGKYDTKEINQTCLELGIRPASFRAKLDSIHIKPYDLKHENANLGYLSKTAKTAFGFIQNFIYQIQDEKLKSILSTECTTILKDLSNNKPAILSSNFLDYIWQLQAAEQNKKDTNNQHTRHQVWDSLEQLGLTQSALTNHASIMLKLPDAPDVKQMLQIRDNENNRQSDKPQENHDKLNNATESEKAGNQNTESKPKLIKREKVTEQQIASNINQGVETKLQEIIKREKVTKENLQELDKVPEQQIAENSTPPKGTKIRVIERKKIANVIDEQKPVQAKAETTLPTSNEVPSPTMEKPQTLAGFPTYMSQYIVNARNKLTADMADSEKKKHIPDSKGNYLLNSDFMEHIKDILDAKSKEDVDKQQKVHQDKITAIINKYKNEKNPDYSTNIAQQIENNLQAQLETDFSDCKEKFFIRLNNLLSNISYEHNHCSYRPRYFTTPLTGFYDYFKLMTKALANNTNNNELSLHLAKRDAILKILMSITAFNLSKKSSAMSLNHNKGKAYHIEGLQTDTLADNNHYGAFRQHINIGGEKNNVYVDTYDGGTEYVRAGSTKKGYLTEYDIDPNNQETKKVTPDKITQEESIEHKNKLKEINRKLRKYKHNNYYKTIRKYIDNKIMESNLSLKLEKNKETLSNIETDSINRELLEIKSTITQQEQSFQNVTNQEELKQCMQIAKEKINYIINNQLARETRQQYFSVKSAHQIIDSSGLEVYLYNKEIKILTNEFQAKNSDYGLQCWRICSTLTLLLAELDEEYASVEDLIKSPYIQAIMDLTPERFEKLFVDVYFNKNIRDSEYLTDKHEWCSYDIPPLQIEGAINPINKWQTAANNFTTKYKEINDKYTLDLKNKNIDMSFKVSPENINRSLPLNLEWMNTISNILKAKNSTEIQQQVDKIEPLYNSSASNAYYSKKMAERIKTRIVEKQYTEEGGFADRKRNLFNRLNYMFINTVDVGKIYAHKNKYFRPLLQQLADVFTATYDNLVGEKQNAILDIMIKVVSLDLSQTKIFLKPLKLLPSVANPVEVSIDLCHDHVGACAKGIIIAGKKYDISADGKNIFPPFYGKTNNLYSFPKEYKEKGYITSDELTELEFSTKEKTIVNKIRSEQLLSQRLIDIKTKLDDFDKKLNRILDENDLHKLLAENNAELKYIKDHLNQFSYENELENLEKIEKTKYLSDDQKSYKTQYNNWINECKNKAKKFKTEGDFSYYIKNVNGVAEYFTILDKKLNYIQKEKLAIPSRQQYFNFEDEQSIIDSKGSFVELNKEIKIFTSSSTSSFQGNNEDYSNQCWRISNVLGNLLASLKDEYRDFDEFAQDENVRAIMNLTPESHEQLFVDNFLNLYIDYEKENLI